MGDGEAEGFVVVARRALILQNDGDVAVEAGSLEDVDNTCVVDPGLGTGFDAIEFRSHGCRTRPWYANSAWSLPTSTIWRVDVIRVHFSPTHRRLR